MTKLGDLKGTVSFVCSECKRVYFLRQDEYDEWGWTNKPSCPYCS